MHHARAARAHGDTDPSIHTHTARTHARTNAHPRTHQTPTHPLTYICTYARARARTHTQIKAAADSGDAEPRSMVEILDALSKLREKEDGKRHAGDDSDASDASDESDGEAVAIPEFDSDEEDEVVDDTAVGRVAGVGGAAAAAAEPGAAATSLAGAVPVKRGSLESGPVVVKATPEEGAGPSPLKRPAPENSAQPADYPTGLGLTSHADRDQSEDRKEVSLYLSQIPYEATKAKIIAHFEAAGCTVEVVRIIMDRAKGVSKGSAIIECKDAQAHENGLKLHRTKFGGRLMNVRPLVSPQELAKIVAKRVIALEKQGLRLDYRTAAAVDKKDGNRSKKGDFFGKKRDRDDGEDGDKTWKKSKPSHAGKDGDRQQWKKEGNEGGGKGKGGGKVGGFSGGGKGAGGRGKGGRGGGRGKGGKGGSRRG